MNRRGFLTALTATIVVPKFGRFFREGSGALWRAKEAFFVQAGAYYEMTVLRPYPAGIGFRDGDDYLPLPPLPRITDIRVPGPATEADVRRVMQGAGIWNWDRSQGAVWRPCA